ncbi:MAG: protoporphyrinogen oxidase [bacterium]|nr:protoporphyrinogen oxidase [bacterium]
MSLASSARRFRVVIIGGGITGLTACYRLSCEVQQHKLPVDITLLEASERLGGVIKTSVQQDFLLEHGPDCFITTKPWAVELCEALGLSDQLIGTTTQHRRSFILRHGRLAPVPAGFYLMAPASLGAFATSSILSWRGKFRLLGDLVVPRRSATHDESLAHFVTRRLGREALERVAQPMVGGIYTADPEHLSMQATMPQFLDMERRHGSLIRAMLHNRRAAQHNQATTQGTSGPRYGMFVSFPQGMQTLVDSLAAHLPDQTVRLQTSVRGLQQPSTSSGWRIHLQHHPDVEADALCLALHAPRAGQLLADTNAELSTALQDIPYASSAIVNLAYRRSDVAHPLNGMGFVVPAIEKRTIMACSFISVKFAGRAPDDHVLLRVFIGGALQSEQYELSDHDMQHIAHQELQPLLGISDEPVYVTISRHAQSMPQYHLEHLQRVAGIETLANRLPGLVLAGNAYHGVGIPDCVHSGNVAAQALLKILTDT